MSEWISVEDKLPSDETPVLICMYNGKLKIGELRWDYPSWEETYSAFRYWDCPYADGQGWNWCDITHWQPLPEPPR